jgi:hypothetical protein
MKVLAFVEHIDRELDFITLVKELLRREHGVVLEIANFYADAPLLLNGPAPRVVLTPFFYATEDVVLRDYVDAWPEARFINLAWEQLFYPSHAAIKAPRDAFTHNVVRHLAWSPAFARYLADNGCAPGNVRLIGHGVYKLYDRPYSAYFISREELARRHGLDPRKRWVFVPENYRWAFFSDTKLRKLGKRGVAAEDLFAMRDYCQRSLVMLTGWCQTLAKTSEYEVTFRPRPATSVEEITDFFTETLGGETMLFKVNKAESAREWVFASDVIASSHSTVLIEGALAEKTVVKVEPYETPASLHYDWCELLAHTKTEAEFLRACRGGDPAFEGEALRAWARNLFFQAGDPALALARWIAEEAREIYALAPPAPVAHDHMKLTPAELASARAMSPAQRHDFFEQRLHDYFFNRSTHEKDLFDATEVDARVARWAGVLAPVAANA